MIKEIQYTGYTTEPSDYECADGQLATSLNIISEDGQLKPIFQPATRLSFSAGYRVLFIHKTSRYEHYIILNSTSGELFWCDSSSSSVSMLSGNKIGSFYAVSHINAVGNTLMVFSSASIDYLLWKSGKYNILGNRLPEIAISFGLFGVPRLWSKILNDENGRDRDDTRGTFSVSFDKIDRNKLFSPLSDDNKTKITAQVMAKVNKFIAEETIGKGRFCFPFFVRWAYRLYDGSHVMHSPPVLMCPSTTPAPIVMWTRATGNGSYTSADCDIMLMAAQLDYCLTRYGNYYDLDRWKDIIAGIDIYISKPIYTYDQSGEIDSFNDSDNFDSRFIGRLNLPRDLANIAMEYPYSDIYQRYYGSVPNTTLHLPEFDDDKQKELIEDVAQFYKLASLNLDELKVGDRTVISVDDDYLQSLANREVMTDDYLSHDRLMASQSFGYNSRLNLIGIRRELFKGFVSNAMFSNCQQRYSLSSPQNGNVAVITPTSIDSGRMKIRVYIRDDNMVYYVDSEADYFMPALRRFVSTVSSVRTTSLSDGSRTVTTYTYDTATKKIESYDSSGNLTSSTTATGTYRPTAWAAWLFYPNANAFKVAVYDDGRLAFQCDLKPHAFLNGAYAFLGFKSERGGTVSSSSLPDVAADRGDAPCISEPGKVYTSAVNNPFYFPVTGINTIGTGTVLGICSAAKALSQGQFGQFPLYAFTTDGVWALEVSATGSYSAKQPITRDVCIDADSITQIDEAVLFATDRGIMLIQGSQTSCITDSICSQSPFNVLDLPGVVKMHALMGHSSDACLPVKPFRTFLNGCRMLYDYVHQHIIVFNPTIEGSSPVYTYAYVYSLKSKQWGMMYSRLASAINAYPEALAMTHDDTLVSFSSIVHDSLCQGLYITRPIKLGASDIHKTISALIQRGHFQRGDVGTALYGSRDLYSWHLVWSSNNHYLRGFRGTPYKYFRIAGLATLSDGKSIFGASVNFELRQTNNLR